MDTSENDERLDERNVVELISDAIQILVADEPDIAETSLGEDHGSVSVTNFRKAGVMTNDAGLVVRVGGCEFQVTVVRSR